MVPPRGTARLCAFCARCNVNVLGGVGLITSLGTYVEMGWGGVGLKTSFGTCTPTWCYVVRDGVGWGICLACYTCKNVLHATRAYVRCHGNNICCYACTCYVLGVWCSVDGLCRIPQRPKKKQIGLQPADMYDLTKENAWLPWRWKKVSSYCSKSDFIEGWNIVNIFVIDDSTCRRG